MSKKVNSLILVLIFMALTCTNAFAAPEFQTSANKDQKIKTLQDQGYLHGYADGSLKLEDKIKRSEFATVIVYALEKQDLAKELQGKSEPFTDVKKEYWANGIISVIKDGKGLNNNISIIAGYPDGTFKPENKISNAEAIKMLVCLKKSDLTKEMIDNAKWPTSWIAWAKEEGIIGKNSNISEDLDYSAEALRGDVFTMFYNGFMESDKKTSENLKSPIKSVPVINVRDTRRGYRESHSYNPPFKYEEGRPLTPLTPAEPYIPLTPLEPAEPYIPLTPLEPAEPYIPLTPLEPAEPVEEVKEYTLTAGEEVEGLTKAKDNGKYDKGIEITFTVKEEAGKTVKVEKVVNGKTEELTAKDGEYSFKLEADTTIKVTYEDIQYTVTTEAEEGAIQGLENGSKHNAGTDLSFTVEEKAGKTVKVEKVVNGKTEELTAKDGEYSFKLEADTTIKVTYEDIDYTLTVEDPENGVTNLTPAKENNKYNEGTEISFTVEEKAGKTVKVEKVVNGKTEELTAKDGEYKFTIEADTIIKVTYEDIDYTLTVEDPENGVTNLTPAKENNKYNEGTEISFTIKVAGKKAKVEKIVGGKSTTLTKGEDGKYSFKMTSDTTIEVTYEDVEQYTLRKDDLENGIKNLTIEDAEGNKYNAGSKISFTVEDKPGKVANVRTVIGNLLDSAGEQKGIKATVIKKGPDGKYSFNIATDTTIRVSYKLVSARANKYDKVFVNTYEVNPERVMNIYKNTRQPNQPNATLGAYNYSFDGDNFVFMINREIEDKRITAMRGTGLADGLVGIFTSNLAGKAPQKFLKKVTLVEKNTGEKVELNESDLKSFSDKWFGFNTMMKKGFPGMNVQSKLSDLAGKKFDVTYEYQEGNTVYKKARTLEFNYDYK